MSGGVDSSVVAALLKNRGYNVIGVFMRMHKDSSSKDAKIVAQKLKIPFYVLDVQKEFKKKVVDYFINEYKKGNTPNPCVMCNKYIKFKFLIDRAIELGADYVATGHYARLGREIRNSKSEIRKLFIASDKLKDQSYFLWQLNQKQLGKILFPLGDYTKEQVRGLAKKFKLPIHSKPESQDVCFAVPRRSFQAKVGNIVTIDGKIVGKHNGIEFYTIGQRKGLEIGGIGPARHGKPGVAGGPFYVVKKDFKRNALIVSRNEKDLMQKELTVKDLNFLTGKPYNGKCKIKIRSTGKVADATIKGNKVIFKQSQRAIASGQSAVIYLKDELIGGGIIK